TARAGSPRWSALPASSAALSACSRLKAKRTSSLTAVHCSLARGSASSEPRNAVTPQTAAAPRRARAPSATRKRTTARGMQGGYSVTRASVGVQGRVEADAGPLARDGLDAARLGVAAEQQPRGARELARPDDGPVEVLAVGPAQPDEGDLGRRRDVEPGLDD